MRQRVHTQLKPYRADTVCLQKKNNFQFIFKSFCWIAELKLIIFTHYMYHWNNKERKYSVRPRRLWNLMRFLCGKRKQVSMRIITFVYAQGIFLQVYSGDTLIDYTVQSSLLKSIKWPITSIQFVNHLEDYPKKIGLNWPKHNGRM